MSAVVGVGRAVVDETADAAGVTQDLYEKHAQRVFTFCYGRLRNREEAQDAAQTTFIYAMRSLQRGVVPEFELAWLLKIAFNVCRSTRRSLGRRPVAADQDISELADPKAPRSLEDSEQLVALRNALGALPENQRRGILLREWQGLSYAEIADELGLSVGAVETLLFRARRNLTARLKDSQGALGAINVALLARPLRSLLKTSAAKFAAVAATTSIGLLPVVAQGDLQIRAQAPNPGFARDGIPYSTNPAAGSSARSPARLRTPATAAHPAATASDLGPISNSLSRAAALPDDSLPPSQSAPTPIDGLPSAGSAQAGRSAPSSSSVSTTPPLQLPAVGVTLPALAAPALADTGVAVSRPLPSIAGTSTPDIGATVPPGSSVRAP